MTLVSAKVTLYRFNFLLFFFVFVFLTEYISPSKLGGNRAEKAALKDALGLGLVVGGEW